MFIESVLEHVYPIKEKTVDELNYSKEFKDALKNLGDYLDNVYHKGGSWKCGYVNPTAATVAELYDIYKTLVHDGVNPSAIKTISQDVADCLGCLGFKVKVDQVGWGILEAKYTFKDIPAWAKKTVKDNFDERQTYNYLYDAGNFIELSYREGGDNLTFRVYKDGTVTER